MEDYTDIELLSLFRDENKKSYAFNLLVRKYQERLYWHIRKILINHEDSDDALQNTFIKVWNNLSRFREDSKLFTWIYRIATNEALLLLKQKKKRSIIASDDANELLINSLESSEYIDGNELQINLQKAVLSLPEKQRLVFNMKYFDEMKYDDISEILGTSVGALKASYHHAVKKIEKYITGN